MYRPFAGTGKRKHETCMCESRAPRLAVRAGGYSIFAVKVETTHKSTALRGTRGTHVDFAMRGLHSAKSASSACNAF